MINGNWIRRRVDQVLVPVVKLMLQEYTTLAGEISTLTTDVTTLQTTLTSDVTSLTSLIGTDIVNLQNTIATTYAPLASPPLTGTPTAPTPTTTDSSNTLATTAFVVNKIAAATTGVSSVLGNTGAISLAELTDGGVAPSVSPALTGTPTAPTPTAGNSSTLIPTTAFVGTALTNAGTGWFPSAAGKLLGGSGTAGQTTTVTLGGGLSLTGTVLSATYSYTLPTATASVLGGVKPDGTTITNTSGVISVTYGTVANTAVAGNDSRIVGALSAATAATTYAPKISPSFTNNAIATGGFISEGFDGNGANFRLYSNATGYGAFWKNDNTLVSLLLTANGSPLGAANTLRPFTVNVTTGAVLIDGTGVGTSFGGSATVESTLTVAPSSGQANLNINALGGGGREYVLYAATAGTAGFFNSTTGRPVWSADTSDYLIATAPPPTDVSSRVVTSSWVYGAMSTIATAAGVYFSAGNPGYLKLPSYLGGWMIQWCTDVVAGGPTYIAFPWAFPNAGLALVCCESYARGSWGSGQPTVHGWSDLSAVGYTAWAEYWTGSGWIGGYCSQAYIAVGY